MIPGFPENFVFGAATAAYQIEGSAAGDGKGASVWDMLCRQPGRIWEGHTGDVACDHYRRWQEDVAIMREIGIQAYRFSIAWPRVMPEGVGRINAAGLAFYDRLVDALLAAGVEPWVTLFHWDFPHALFLRGGWLNADSPQWFSEYVQAVVDRLSDRVRHWITLNEPQCFVWFGHSTGMHAPGVQYGFEEVLLAGHHALLAHGYGVQAIRARARRPPIIGWAPVGLSRYPASNRPEDVEAARRAMFGATERTLWSNAWWADPVFFGRYPEDALRLFGRSVPAQLDHGLDIIRQPLDFYGVNIYEGVEVAAGPDGNPVSRPYPAGFPHTHFLWKVTPEALHWGPRLIHERYRCPIVVTENGLSVADWIGVDGRVRDPQRVDYLTRYLRALWEAMRQGTEVRGYFHWSLLDNFEWAEGYKHRFGLVHVDFATQQRVLKDSAHWFHEVIRDRGRNLGF